MKKKNVFKILFSFAVSFALLPIGIIFATPEDYTTYTEYDPSSKVEITDNETITFTDLDQLHDAYIYKDYGADYFSDGWSFHFSANITTTSASGNEFCIFALSNSINNYYWHNQSGTGIFVLAAHDTTGHWKLDFMDIENGSNNSLDSTYVTGLECGVTYYFHVYDDEGDLQHCDIYSDEAETVLVDNTQCAYSQSGDDYRYVYQIMSVGQSPYSGYPASGILKNLDMSPITIPTLELLDTTVYFDSPTEDWYAWLSANVTSSNQDTLTSQGFYYKKEADSVYTYVSAGFGGYCGDNETFCTITWELEHGETYDLYAVATNVAGTANTSVEQFYVGYNGTAPVIVTLSTVQINIEGSSAVVYGQVEDYGGANTTGYFKWKESTESSWTTTANTTDLVTNDTFFQGLTGLESGKTYQYYAVGQNENGTRYGSIRTFVFNEITTPIITTVSVTNVTSSTAYFNAYLDFSGDNMSERNCNVYFRYKPSNSSTWQISGSVEAQTGDNITIQVAGLTPLTAYDFGAVGYILSEDLRWLFGYGDTLAFNTLNQYGVPVVITGNVTNVAVSVIRSNGSLYYDGGLPCTVNHQIREKGLTDWNQSSGTSNVTSGDTFYTIVSGLESNTTYEYRWIAYNTLNTAYGSTLEFTLSNTGTVETQTSDTSETGVSQISNTVNTVKQGLGLTGIMGSWAFLGLCEVGIALVFGICFMIVENKMGKTAIGVAWLLTSISILGAFIFSGELGIWPLIIMIGGTVLFLMITVGVKLSGGTQNG